jgi:hypothetical protein
MPGQGMKLRPCGFRRGQTLAAGVCQMSELKAEEHLGTFPSYGRRNLRTFSASC